MPPSVLTGRVVRPGEPEWTQQDTDLAVALTELDAATCGGCGQPMAESMAMEADGGYLAEAWRCHACAARERAARSWGEDTVGLKFAVTRVGGGGHG